MPKYYKYNNGAYSEFDYSELFLNNLNKYEICKSIFGGGNKLPAPISREELLAIAKTYRDQLDKIISNKPKPPTLPDPPQEPSEVEKRPTFNIYTQDEIGTEIVLRDPGEFKKDKLKYKEDIKQWNSDKEKAESEYQSNLKIYNNKYSKDEIKYKEICIDFNNLDDQINSDLSKLIKIPSADEVYNAFNDKLNNGVEKGLHSQKRKEQLKELAGNIKAIYESSDGDEIKSSKMLSAILDTYRKIIRSYSGTPSVCGIFGKGSDLARQLHAFCRKEYGINLPEKLEKGQPLAIDQPPINSNKICAYFEVIQNTRKFTPD